MANATIVAVFDTASHAEQAIADLRSAGLPTGAIEQFAEGEERTSAEEPRSRSGFWSWLTGEAGTTERPSQHEIYDRSIASGHTVVTVVVDSARADEVMALLDQHSPLDVDQHGGTDEAAAEATGATVAAPIESVSTTRPAAASGEQIIRLSEETLQVGTTTIDRGVTRVRRFVVERPVEEQIRLRDERVSVFRRPVSGEAAASTGADAFSDKTVEVTETKEAAVVGKTARVVEEVVVQKTAGERVETIRDTVRHEEVDIDGPQGGGSGSSGTES